MKAKNQMSEMTLYFPADFAGEVHELAKGRGLRAGIALRELLSLDKDYVNVIKMFGPIPVSAAGQPMVKMHVTLPKKARQNLIEIARQFNVSISSAARSVLYMALNLVREGRPATEKTRKINIQLSDWNLKRADDLAREHHLSRSEVLRVMLIQGLDMYGINRLFNGGTLG